MKYFHYKPVDGWLADVIPFYWNGAFQLFYLHDYRDITAHGEGVPWRRIETRDFVHFEEKGEMIPRGGMEEQDLFIFTGSILRAEGKFHIFYTGHNHHLIPHGMPQEAIMHAVSDDLDHWEKCSQELFFAPDDYEMHDWRDPFVFYDENDEQYHMILAARKKAGAAQKKGCTAHCVSNDLASWRVVEPLWSPELYFTHECPDLFRMGDWYYLLYSEFSDEFRTRYVRSQSLYGPWEAPADDVFDSRAFYAAKTASDGQRRYLFGWAPTREGNRDDGAFQWGGHLIVHEIWQDADGNLRVKMPSACMNAFSKPWQGEIQAFSHAMQKEAGWHLHNPSGYAEIGTTCDLPQVCLVSADISLLTATQGIGLRFRHDRESDLSYALTYHPYTRQWSFICIPRNAFGHLSEFGLQRYMPEGEGKMLHIHLLMDHDLVTLYVNNKIALSARMCRGEKNAMSFFLAHGVALIQNIQVSTRVMA